MAPQGFGRVIRPQLSNLSGTPKSQLARFDRADGRGVLKLYEAMDGGAERTGTYSQRVLEACPALFTYSAFKVKADPASQ